MNQLEAALKKAKYKTKRISAKRVAVLTNENRKDVLATLQGQLGASWDKRPTGASSIGMLMVDGFAVLAKPAKRQGNRSAGVNNEVYCVDQINYMIKESDGVIETLVFKAGRKTFTIKGVVGCKRVGADTAGKKKADFLIETNKRKSIPISLKKDGAEMWESADNYYGEKAKEKVDNLALEKTIELLPMKGGGGVMTIKPNIAIKSTKAEKESVIFGSDILKGKGCVITRTFSKDDFNLEGDVLTIEVTDIYNSMASIPDYAEPYFLIRNDRTRASPKLYPGLRVLAVYKKRINKNVKIVR